MQTLLPFNRTFSQGNAFKPFMSNQIISTQRFGTSSAPPPDFSSSDFLKTNSSGTSQELSMKKPSWMMIPFIKLVGHLYTRPKIIQSFVPGSDHMMPDKYLSHYQPFTVSTFQTQDGLTLKGTWLPANQVNPITKENVKSSRTVILGHGYTANSREMLGTSLKLREKGYNTFVFDFRAHGKSQGKFTSIGFNEGKDLSAAINFVKAQYPEETKSLFYVGHSMGTAALMMSPLSLANLPSELDTLTQNLKGIVLDSPFFSFQEIATRFIKDCGKVAPDHLLVKLIAAPLLQSKLGDSFLNGMKWMAKDFLNLETNLFTLNPAEILANSPLGKKPILVLHGDNDTVTPTSHGQRVYETLKSKSPDTVSFQLIEGQGHMDKEWHPLASELVKPTKKRYKKEKYWSSERGNISNQIVQFLDGIPFKGRLKTVTSSISTTQAAA